MREDAFGNGGLARRCFDLDSRFRGKGFGAGNSSGAWRESVQCESAQRKSARRESAQRENESTGDFLELAISNSPAFDVNR